MTSRFPQTDVTSPPPAPGSEPANELLQVEVDPLVLKHQRQLLLAKMFGSESQPPRLGRYVLCEELDRDGMGVVYKAHDPELNRFVAIRLSMCDHFQRGAQALVELEHPNVVEVYETGVDENGRPFMVMEYVQGQNLRQWLGEYPRDIDEIFEVFAAAGRGLGFVHDKGIVHHDFKLENVLIGDDGRVRLAGFGLAEAGDARRGTLDSQFAFCVSLNEALADAGPRSKNIPRRLEAAIRKGLSVRPEDRHASMSALTDALALARTRPILLRWFAGSAVLLTLMLALFGVYVLALLLTGRPL